MNIPKLIKVRQQFDRQHISDIEGTVKRQIAKSGVVIRKGSSIAIAAGSRGVANIHRIVKATVEYVKEQGGNPFIVPAMGSHGEGTAEGQKEVLEGYGITEEYTGAPIRSSMEVVELPQEGVITRVYMDKQAYNADGTIIINRVKVHTDFHGPHESGLMKMCVIGLGKHKQALAIHRYGTYGLRELILPVARQVLKHGNIILAIGAVENAYDETLALEAILPGNLEEKEKELLELARRNMPRLPVDKLDILIVDQLGKNISGAGMDTNIIGRMYIKGEPEPETPRITNVIVADITAESHGNATGIGLADITTRRLFDKINLKATYENIVTSTFLQRGKMPIIAESDGQAMEYALRTCGPIEIDQARVIRIKNTLHLDELLVSPAVLEEIKNKSHIEIIGEYRELIKNNGEFAEF